MKKLFPIGIVALAMLMVYFKAGDLPPIFAKPKLSDKETLYKHYESSFSKLEIVTTHKKKVKLAEAKAKIVIVNFWASWCTPCLQEFPSLNQLREKYTEDQIAIYAIKGDAYDQSVKGKKNRKEFNDKYSFDIVYDPDGAIFDKFLISAIPVSIIFVNGKVINDSNGAFEFFDDKFLKKMDKILAAKK